jgi:hypothetical protein
MSSYSYTGTFTLDEEEIQVEFSSSHTEEAGIKKDALKALVAEEPSKKLVVVAIGQLANFTFVKK